ncbi:MAG: glutamate--tRNA ligase, partial [Candidatus Veblenbacteria bacterium]|nr:glutamate--tRNA ligase [Candidatus Veblenbacteria bacterium]
NLTPEEVEAKLKEQLPHAVRLKVPSGSTVFTDQVRGEVKVDNANLDDSVLLKSDGYPTYHLANVVDDHVMGITHVIRGEEWLPSTPKHILLYQAFDWTPPVFAHLPNVLNDKRAKLSKRRDGEAVWLSTYQQQGYLPQAMVNFLALLGWHPKDNQELFTLGELEQAFTLERVQKAGAIFNLVKLNWFNAEYLKKLPLEKLDELLQPHYQELQATLGRQVPQTSALTALLRDRLTTPASVKEHAAWFFKSQPELSRELLIPKNSTAAKTLQALSLAQGVLEQLSTWSSDDLRNALEVLVRPGTFSRAELLWPVRVALTGERQSPDVFDVASALGRPEALARLKQAERLLTN